MGLLKSMGRLTDEILVEREEEKHAGNNRINTGSRA
jgi:hypothetical protein